MPFKMYIRFSMYMYGGGGGICPWNSGRVSEYQQQSQQEQSFDRSVRMNVWDTGTLAICPSAQDVVQ